MPDGGWVLLLEVLECGQGRSRSQQRFGRKGQDLEAGTIEGDKVLLNETSASLQALLVGNLERGTDAMVCIIADAISVSCQHQEKVQRAFGRVERSEETLVQKAVGNESKTFVDTTDALGSDRGSVDAVSDAVGHDLYPDLGARAV
jgi:hypothetical protein